MNVGSVQDFQVFPNEVYTEQGFVLCFVFPSLPVLLESVLYFVSKQPNQNLDRQGIHFCTFNPEICYPATSQQSQGTSLSSPLSATCHLK